jgi:hypothetical protein
MMSNLPVNVAVFFVGHSRPRPKPSRMPHLRQRQLSTGGNGKWRGMTHDEIEKLVVGDRIRRVALTGTVHTVGPELIGIKWDDKEWSELYTRVEMVQFSLHSDGELR